MNEVYLRGTNVVTELHATPNLSEVAKPNHHDLHIYMQQAIVLRVGKVCAACMERLVSEIVGTTEMSRRENGTTKLNSF